MNIWIWLCDLWDYRLVSSLEDCRKIIDNHLFARSQVVHIATVMNSIACIWNARNQERLHSKMLHWKSNCVTILFLTSLSVISHIVKLILLSQNLCYLRSSRSYCICLVRWLFWDSYGRLLNKVGLMLILMRLLVVRLWCCLWQDFLQSFKWYFW